MGAYVSKSGTLPRDYTDDDLEGFVSDPRPMLVGFDVYQEDVSRDTGLLDANGNTIYYYNQKGKLGYI